MGRISGSSAHARTRPAPGRAVWASLLALVLAGCAIVGGRGGRAGDAPLDPVLSPNRPSQAAEAAAARSFEEAREAVSLGDLDRARGAAQEVVDRYPGAPVSGRALRLLVDVAFEQSSWREADLLAQRWIRLVPEDDPRIPVLRLLQGEARLRDGDPGGALDRLVALRGDDQSDMASTLDLVRRSGAALAVSDLDPRLGALPLGHPFRPPLLAARARSLYNSGDDERARTSAEDALAAGAAGTDAEVSRAVLARLIDETLGLTGPVTVVGVLLPKSGPPALARFADLVEEGVRSAAAAAGLPSRIEIVVEDDRGTAEGAAAGMRALEQAGAIVVVGPLNEPALSAAVRARGRPIPLISPTAPDIVAGAEYVYTLGAPDLEGARALALWAAGSGLSSVALLHPLEAEFEEEAAAFMDAFRAAGGRVIGQFTYGRGTTSFQTQMEDIAELRPDALVLPIPAEDVEIVAPQITFFGLDTLDVRILGTAGWTREDVLGAVSARHTDGVVSVTPDPIGQGVSPGSQTLVRVYEELFRRTLRSPVPAVGYDATALLLEALRGGARSPQNIAAMFERTAAFQGATGHLDFQDGRVVRRHQLACVHDRTLSPIAIGERPELIDRRPQVLPGEEPPPMDGPPFQVVCPGTLPLGSL